MPDVTTDFLTGIAVCAGMIVFVVIILYFITLYLKVDDINCKLDDLNKKLDKKRIGGK